MSFSNTLIIPACVILIILLLLVYLRSRQGDQRIIQTTNQMFLPLLSAIVITLAVLYSNQQASGVCSQNIQGIPNLLRYVATIGAVLIIAVGALRFARSRRRDRRLLTHPVLFAIILVLAVFAIEQVVGCM